MNKTIQNYYKDKNNVLISIKNDLIENNVVNKHYLLPMHKNDKEMTQMIQDKIDGYDTFINTLDVNLVDYINNHLDHFFKESNGNCECKYCIESNHNNNTFYQAFELILEKMGCPYNLNKTNK